MDIKKFQLGGEWLELEAENEKIGQLRFKILPSSIRDQFTYLKAFIGDHEKIIEEIIKLVIEWSLESDGEALPCTNENKKIYIPHLIGIFIKKDEVEQKENKELDGIFSKLRGLKVLTEAEMGLLAIYVAKSSVDRRSTVGNLIIEFASDIGNFVKN